MTICMKNQDFQPISRFISELIQDRAIVTMEGEYETVPRLLNGTSFNDLERPLTQFSRLHYFLTLVISQTAKDMAIFTINCE